jgi:hypothetical protein
MSLRTYFDLGAPGIIEVARCTHNCLELPPFTRRKRARFIVSVRPNVYLVDEVEEVEELFLCFDPPSVWSVLFLEDTVGWPMTTGGFTLDGGEEKEVKVDEVGDMGVLVVVGEVLFLDDTEEAESGEIVGVEVCDLCGADSTVVGRFVDSRVVVVVVVTAGVVVEEVVAAVAVATGAAEVAAAGIVAAVLVNEGDNLLVISECTGDVGISIGGGSGCNGCDGCKCCCSGRGGVIGVPGVVNGTALNGLPRSFSSLEPNVAQSFVVAAALAM